MPNFRRIGAIALAAAIAIQLIPPQANAQGVLVIPEAAAIVIIGGIAYYVWTNSEGLREQVAVPSSSMPMLEDPEDEAQWGTYPDVKSFEGCRWAAAGRDWNWDRKTSTCYIKG
jgi:hypothetical protein